ncbi:MAG: DUF2071 domain-containing protein [Syntrophus sp. (in: bacteria)]|nr:DUF2071 domain-containing protein [Syntrophus sp. (in: bacteria)]
MALRVEKDVEMVAQFQRLMVKMELQNVLYLSYLVPVDRLRPMVPPGLRLNATGSAVFLSIVAMQCRKVHLSFLGWPSVSYDQLNLRTYVIDPKTGDPAVYFFRSGVSSNLIPVATRLLGIPWERISFSLAAEQDGSGADFYKAAGDWNGEIEIQMKSAPAEDSDATVIDVITGPLAGFIGSGERLKRIAIKHQVLDVRRLSLLQIRFPLPVEAGLLAAPELEKPDSVLIVPESQFSVFI